MELKICLCVMCGIPGSGKTSFCQRLNQKFGDSYMVININYDKILLSSEAPQAQYHQSMFENRTEVEGNLAKAARRHVEKLLEVILQNFRKDNPKINLDSLDEWNSIDENVKSSFLKQWEMNSFHHFGDMKSIILLLDDNMHLRSMRYDIYKLARQYCTGFCEIFMDIQVERALERNETRQGRDLVDPKAIVSMSQKLEPPDPTKNGWEKYSIALNSDDELELVYSLLHEAMENPVQPSPTVDEEAQVKSQEICSKNLIHQVDLILRKCIAKTIADGKADKLDIRSLSKQAMAVKDDILDCLKKGRLKISIQSSNVENASKDENCDLYKYISDLFSKRLKG